MRLRVLPILLCLCSLYPAGPTQGQQQRPGTGAAIPLPSVSGPSDDRLRVNQLLGRASTDGYLLRSTASLLPRLPEDSVPQFRLQFLLPTLQTIWNSDIPYSSNDGALFAGRGLNAQIAGGFRAAYGPVSLVFAPEIRYEQNIDFPFVSYPDADRSPYSARWHWASLPISIDLPTRFGDEYRAALGPGQSSLSVGAGPVVFGWTRDDQWWGPGLRNAIVMSNNAGGLPRIFARTGPPIATPVGDFEVQWTAGRMQESVHFDTIPRNDLRQLSGFILTYSPAAEPGLTLGASRTVVGRLSGMDDFPERMFAAFLNKERREEQIASLFGRWVFPSAGFEAYGEWARHRLARSLRDFLISPNHTQGYTAGLQWVRPVRPDSSGMLRLHSEITYLEQSTTTRHRPTGSFYTSDSLPQGYTHRGQVIGAAIGPGASSQFLAGDYLADGWQIGLFAGRIRWDNDAYYLTQEPFPLDHDVSVFAGLRGGTRLGGTWMDLELTRAKRFNFMFQNDINVLGGGGTWDVDNHTLRLTITPASSGRGDSR